MIKMICLHLIQKCIDMKTIYISLLNLFLITFSSTCLLANESSSLSIYTFDENSFALEGASILLENNQSKKIVGVSTNDDGRGYFDNLIAGEYSIKLSFIGYNDVYKKINIKPGKTYKYKIQMKLNTIAITELEIINDYNRSMVGAATSINAQDLEIITAYNQI